MQGETGSERSSSVNHRPLTLLVSGNVDARMPGRIGTAGTAS